MSKRLTEEQVEAAHSYVGAPTGGDPAVEEDIAMDVAAEALVEKLKRGGKNIVGEVKKSLEIARQLG